MTAPSSTARTRSAFTPRDMAPGAPAPEQDAAKIVDALAAMPLSDPGRAMLRERAIEAFRPMAHRLARRYARRGEPLDDLLQTAMIGLIKAVDRYDPDRGLDFIAYAIPTVLGEIKRYFRDHAWTIRVPRRLQEMRMAINDANSTLSHTLRRVPTVTDIATYLGVSEEAVIEGLEGARAYSATSLSTPAGADGSMEHGETLGTADRGYEMTELHMALGPALDRLSERERRIVTLRFFGNQTQTQIAEQIGVSQMHISRLLTAALAKLRSDLGPDAR